MLLWLFEAKQGLSLQKTPRVVVSDNERDPYQAQLFRRIVLFVIPGYLLVVVGCLAPGASVLLRDPNPHVLKFRITHRLSSSTILWI